jgi:hypothetical protein
MNDRPAPPTPPKAPLVALGLLTLATFAGPLVILLVFRGGPRTGWPPDRPVEWWTFGLVLGVYLVLMGVCLTCGLWARPKGR